MLGWAFWKGKSLGSPLALLGWTISKIWGKPDQNTLAILWANLQRKMCTKKSTQGRRGIGILPTLHDLWWFSFGETTEGTERVEQGEQKWAVFIQPFAQFCFLFFLRFCLDNWEREGTTLIHFTFNNNLEFYFNSIFIIYTLLAHKKNMI